PAAHRQARSTHCEAARECRTRRELPQLGSISRRERFYHRVAALGAGVSDTPPGFRPTGSRFIPAGSPASPHKALPAPVHVSRRVLVAVQDPSTGGTEVGTHPEALLHPRPTPTTVLAGMLSGHSQDSFASVYCFAFEDRTALPPAGSTAALGEVRVPYAGGHPQVFGGDDIVLAHQQRGRRVVESASLPLHLLVFSRQQVLGFT